MKNYRNKWAKLAAFVLTVLLITLTGILALESLLKQDYFDSAFDQNYLRSNEFGQKIYDANYQVEEAISNLPKAVSIMNEDTDLENLTFGGAYNQSGNLSDVDYYFYYKTDDLEITNVGLQKILDQKYYVGIQPNNYNLKLNPRLSKEEQNHIIYNGYINNIINNKIESFYAEKEDAILYIAYHDNVIEKEIVKFHEAQDYLQKSIFQGSIMLGISLLLIIYLSIVAGRKPEDDELHLWKIDKMFGEIHLILIGFSIFAYTYTIIISFNTLAYNYYGEKITILLTFIASILILAFTEMLWLSLCRKIKQKPRRNIFFTTGMLLSFIISILKKIYGYTKHNNKVFSRIKKPIILLINLIKKLPNKLKSTAKYFDDRLYERFPVTQKIHRLSYIYLALMVALSLLVIIFGLSSLGLFSLIAIGAMIYITINFIKKSRGNFDEINRGFDKGYKESLKAEKMKVDLITNVSHDLKTPLTSIISYAELLKSEEMSDVAKDYVQILDKKAKRLNVIVGDLFDLSKSTSGNLSFELEEINLKKLIEQTYADMEDKISASQLKFVLQLPDDPVNIYADGKKMYRVFQNLFDNALKYSLNGTRIYVTLENIDNIAIATVKNIASYEMNFAEDEIAERFTRGDSSRTTEGSGLGLSIAESFTQNCLGQFKISIDGDLFKVTLKFQTI